MTVSLLASICFSCFTFRHSQDQSPLQLRPSAKEASTLTTVPQVFFFSSGICHALISDSRNLKFNSIKWPSFTYNL